MPTGPRAAAEERRSECWCLHQVAHSLVFLECNPLAGISNCFTEQVHLVSPGASEAKEHNTRSGQGQVFSWRPEKGFRLQVLQQRILPVGWVSLTVTRGRAREGSLRSSTLLWDPYRCSHAARSVGKREEKSAVRESRTASGRRSPAGAQVSPSPNVTKRVQGTFWSKRRCSAQNANKGHENGHSVTTGLFLLCTLVSFFFNNLAVTRITWDKKFSSKYFKSD